MATVKKNKKSRTKKDPMLVKQFVVRRVIKETFDTFSLEMESQDNNGNFSFAPGQFNMLYVYGIGEVPISISGDPARRNLLVHTVRGVGKVTEAICGRRAGDTLGIRGPYGSSWPVEEAVGNDVVFITGGIGLAPLRPAIYYILAHREDYGKVAILYGTRTPDDILYVKDLGKLRSRFDLETFVTVDRATGDWKGNVGVVTQLIARASFDPLHCVAMVCGPEIMMRFTILELQKRGVKDDHIYISMERNMKCGVGLCGHCQLGPSFVCKDGPVYCYNDMKIAFARREM
jgi:NAD(P)H-flavin reductase